MSDNLFSLACEQLVSWIDDRRYMLNGELWWGGQAPALHEAYNTARRAIIAAQQHMQAIGGPQVEEKSSESQAANA